MGKGAGRPKTSQTLSDWFQKRKEDLAAAAGPADKSDCDEEEASELDDTDESVEERPLLGGCLVNHVTARGKQDIGFEIGDTLVLHYTPEKPDAGCKKFVGETRVV